jgi:hypothetical protein
MDFIFKEGAHVDSADKHYDLFDGGCISPTDLLEDDKQRAAIYGAMGVIKDFLQQAEDAGVLEMM